MTSETSRDRTMLDTPATRRRVLAGAGIGVAGTLAGSTISSDAAMVQTTTEPLPADTALVVSPRLPIWNLTSQAAVFVLDGSASDWSQLGCPRRLAIRRLALDGVDSGGMDAQETIANYDALVESFAADPGSVAVVPLDMVDSHVTALRIDGTDPFAAAGTDAEPVFHVGVVGDMIPGRNVNSHMRGYGDFVFPWRRVAPILSNFDFTFGNFECVISDNLPFPEDQNANALDFVMGTAAVEGLTLSGFDAVSLANNHSVYNNAGWGLQGFTDTIAALDDGGIPRFGAGMNLDEARAPFVGEVAGKSIALIGIDGVTANVDYPGVWSVPVNVGATVSEAGTNPLIEDQILSDITSLAGQYDIVIPFFHMGEQYRWVLSDWAIALCRKAVDAGATTVITSHPHVNQGMEWYNGTPLFYGIGNFIYDQMFTVDTSQGAIVDLTFRGNKVVGFRMHGIQIEDFTQPRLLGPGEHAAFMDRIWRSNDFMREFVNV
jgi:poly-gamma-glutamate synthesis protein (capsule biosynthesis protein)